MKYIVLAVLALALVAGCTAPQETTTTTQQETTTTMQQTTTTQENVKTFIVTGENFKFVMDGKDNPDIVVNQGDMVRIEFMSTDGFHDWVVDEFNAATDKVQTGQSTSVEFIADKTGTFEYYCSVGSHRAAGMMGKLIVQ